MKKKQKVLNHRPQIADTSPARCEDEKGTLNNTNHHFLCCGSQQPKMLPPISPTIHFCRAKNQSPGYPPQMAGETNNSKHPKRA